MAFTLTCGATAGVVVYPGPPYVVQIVGQETSKNLIFIYSDGTSVTVTGTDATDAITALKWLNTHAGISDFVKL